MSERQYLSNRRAKEFFESRLDSLAPDTILKYRRTISALDIFLSTHGLHLAHIDAAMTADWATALLASGQAPSTVARHLNILSSLLGAAAKKGLLPDCETPSVIARRLREKPVVPPLLDEKKYAQAVALLRGDRRQSAGPQAVAVDVVLFSLVAGCMPVEEVARLKKSDIQRAPEGSPLRSMLDRELLLDEIYRRNATAVRAFVFPLNQSQRTPRQLRADLAEALRPLAERIGLIPVGSTPETHPLDPDALVASFWTALAMHAGATAGEALGCVATRPLFAVPDWCETRRIVPEEVSEWIDSVAMMLRRDEPHWYAMQLRRRVDFNDVRKEIAEKVRPLPELFYPCETITRIVRNKKKVLDQPFIRSTAFFRTTPEGVLPIFRAIGHLAWCYRVNNRAGAPYAVIPSAEMHRFQAAVGVFTPDIEVYPIGTLTPEPGEQVIVIAAGYQGRQATVEEVTPSSDGTPALIRVLLTTDQGYEWRLHLTPAQLEKVGERY